MKVRVRVHGGLRLRVRLRLVVPRWGWHRYRPAVDLTLHRPEPQGATEARRAS